MGRAMEALRGLGAAASDEPGGTTATRLAERLERERSQLSRTLAALARLGYAERLGSAYRVSPALYATALALTERRLRTDGLTALEALSERSGEAAFLGTLSGDSTVTIVEAIPPQKGLFGSWVGRSYPAFCSDAGQAVLWDASDAEVRDVLGSSDFGFGGPNAARSVEEFLGRLRAARARGYSIVDEEAEPGLLSVAAPVLDFRGEVVAAMQIVGVKRALAPRIPELGDLCRTAAAELSRRLRSGAAAG